MPRDHLVVTDPGLAQRFLLDRIPRRRAALVMPGALVFDRVAGAAVGVDQQQVDPLGIDAAVGFGVGRGDEFADRDLRHHLPAGVARDHQFVELGKHPRLALVEQRARLEFRLHHHAQLFGRIEQAPFGRAFEWHRLEIALEPASLTARLARIAPPLPIRPPLGPLLTRNKPFDPHAASGTQRKQDRQQPRLVDQGNYLWRHRPSLCAQSVTIRLAAIILALL